MQSKYSRWDGTQEPFGEQFEIGELLDEISDDVLSGLGPGRAVRRLMRRGLPGRTEGLENLRRRLAERRRRWTEATNLEGPLAEVRDKLSEIVAQERSALEQINSDDARSREAFLDALPGSPAAAIKELSDYRFTDPGAQGAFDQLVKDLQEQVLGAYFGQMMGAIQSMTPDELARIREMLADLNAMIDAKQRGEPYNFEQFMDRYGDFFPENPKNLDELLEVLAKRMAAMSRLLASLSPEQRRELQELAGAVMGDLDLALEMEMLGQELRALMPNLPWDESTFGLGNEEMSLSGAVDALGELSDMEELEAALAGQYPGASIDDVDEELLQRSLGEKAVRDLRKLKQIEKALEQAGIVSRDRGRLNLTARGIRQLGERALVQVFQVLRQERPGAHEDPEAGGGAEPTGATRKWHFGDSGDISVQHSLFNAITREAGERPFGSGPVHLEPEDFELIEAESRTRTATALMLDLSFSMILRDHWVPAKKMALALQALIESKYPQDYLYLIGFSDYARRLTTADLTATGPVERVYGTNMQHAFLLARRLLAEHPRASKQVIMVTDGEPTAHLEDQEINEQGPHAFFSWPPTSRTIHKTLAEASRLSAAGVTLNVFMLEEDPGLINFMNQLVQRTQGRIFQAAGKDLGRFILSDFVRRR